MNNYPKELRSENMNALSYHIKTSGNLMWHIHITWFVYSKFYKFLCSVLCLLKFIFG